MKPSFQSFKAITFALAIASLAASAVSAEEVHLQLLSTGAIPKLGGYMPQRLELSATKPDGITKLPADLSAPLYGELKLGPAESPRTFFVVLDEPDGKPSRLFVDANGNGDLTDDDATEWTAKPGTNSDGTVLTMYMGGANVKLPYDNQDQNLHIGIYRFDKKDPQRAELAKYLFYYGDYARVGEITLSGKTYQALLPDSMTTGDFRGPQLSDHPHPPASILIDVNQDGKFSQAFESFPIAKPFNIGGTTYEISGLTASGGTFALNKSSQTVEETKPMAALSAGHLALPFDVKTTDATEVKFPETYKGKVVLLDFWATWCGPCVGEMPNVSAAYDKFHPKGFDILGVSLDQKGDGEKLAAFTNSHSMPWPQIYDGKFWQADIAKQYYIQSIPHAFLVDGDTGKIIAEGNDIRGESLAPAIEKALANKSAGTK
jgi:thiol-disulfide isomerase/thioredoxin